MAVAVGGARVSYSPVAVGKSGYRGAEICHPSLSVKKRNLTVRAAGVIINPSIRKEEAKVVDAVEVSELEKPLTAYCRSAKSIVVYLT